MRLRRSRPRAAGGPRRRRPRHPALFAVIALVMALAVGVPALFLARQEGDAVRAERDQSLRSLALETLFVLEEDPEAPGELDIEAYVASPRPAGSDATAVVDPGGRILAGDVVLPFDTRRRAAARAGRGLEDPVTLPGSDGDVRIVPLPVEGADGTLGVVLASGPAANADDEAADEQRRVLLLALAGWLVASGLLSFAVSRALRPVDASAEAMSGFLADAAHELRTPWAVVRGRAERALAGESPERDLEVIAATAAQAGDTIADMLELARLDAGRAVAEREPIRLDALVSSCAEERAAAAADAGVDVRVRTAGDVVVPGDERLLARAVANLLDNALRHGAAGGLVEVEVSREDGTASVVVADRGPGIPPAQLDTIFDRFHRGSTATGGGSGLGLPIARLAAETHGGSLVAEPATDGGPGARFVLRLPAR